MKLPSLSLVLLCLATSSPAQEWQLEVGAAGARYDSTSWIESASLAPQLSWVRRGFRGSVGGNLASLSSQWSTQGRGEFTFVLGPARDGRGTGAGLVGLIGGSAHSNGYRTGTARGELRVLRAGQVAGAWAGLGASRGWSSSQSAAIQSWGPTAGVWAATRGWSAAAAASPLHLAGSWFPEITAQASTTIGLVELTGYAGFRGASSAAGIASARWAGTSMSVRLTRGLAIMAGGGSYPPDLVQNLPGGRFFSLSLRFSSPRPGTALPASGRTAAYVAQAGEQELVFTVPNATQVDIAGDWNGWQAVPMRRGAGGKWTARVTLPSGVHRFNIIVDGERWLVPDEYASVDDGMGGRAGLLVVP